MITKEEAITIVNKLKNCIEHDACEQMNCAYFQNYEDLRKLEEYVQNAFPIVRCKDCNWCEYDGVKRIRRCGFSKLNQEVFDIFFCFGGERKNEVNL